jgi:putative oxidoreductase
MLQFLERLTDHVYVALRMISGLMFSFHGMQKLFGVLSSHPQPPMGSQTWFGGIIELACGLLVCAGALTRPAAFLASGTMAVAYIQFHWKLALDAKFFPTINQGELAVIYAFLFLYIACRGAGQVSVDNSLRR